MTQVDERRLSRGVFSGYAMVVDDQRVEDPHELDHNDGHTMVAMGLARQVIESEDDQDLTEAQQELVGLLSSIMVVARNGRVPTQPVTEIRDFFRGIWRLIDGRWTP